MPLEPQLTLDFLDNSVSSTSMGAIWCIARMGFGASHLGLFWLNIGVTWLLLEVTLINSDGYFD